MISPPTKLLLIFVGETDVWEDLPLHEAIVRVLERHEIAGATVITGTMGYGVHRRIHRRRLLGASDDRPVVIFVVDNETKLREVLPVIRPMVREGLLALVDAEVLGGEPAP